MSIDLSSESPVPITKAAAFVPGRPHTSTIWRWVQRGVRGIRLETVVVGGRRFTSKEALGRFIASTDAAAQGEDSPTVHHQERQSAVERAERETAQEGI